MEVLTVAAGVVVGMVTVLSISFLLIAVVRRRHDSRGLKILKEFERQMVRNQQQKLRLSKEEDG